MAFGGRKDLLRLKFVCTCVYFIFTLISFANTSRILVLPYVLGRNSRFSNLGFLAELLGEKGHQVTFLTHNRCLPSRLLNQVDIMLYSAPEDLPLPAEDNSVMMNILNGSIFSSNLSSTSIQFCDHFLQDRSFFPMLKSFSYDVIIVDYANTCARILVDYLAIPTIVWSNFGFGIDDDLFHPILPSYIPSTLGHFSDRMNVWQRLRNFCEYHLYNKLILNYYFFWKENNLKTLYGLNSSLSVSDTYRRAKPLIIINGDFFFDYPRPLMPYVIPISGLFSKNGRPLLDYLEEFVQGSGPHGIIIVAFGSLFQYFDEERSNLIARVLSRFPQRIVWRFSTPFPLEKGNNTLVLPWIPQNDLLSHNKTRLFVTHCGISSSYEAIFHGVPIVGIPLMADQWYNCEKLIGRGKLGVQVDFFNLKERELESAIQAVLQNDMFKNNCIKLNENILDKPESPKDKFLFWVEYVVRHRGVNHFYSDAMLDLNWFQYFCLDVILMTIGIVVVTIVVVILAIVLCTKWVSKLCRRTTKEKVN